MMNKIIIIGCPGSGKSTFAKELNKIHKLPLYHLDMIWNKPDKTTITREEFDQELCEIFKKDEWIIDGNYQRTLEKRIKEANTIFLLDYSMDVCIEGATTRVGIKREDMPWAEEALNKDFEQKIINFSQNQLPEIYELLNKYQNSKKIIIFKTRKEAEIYLDSLKNNKHICN